MGHPRGYVSPAYATLKRLLNDRNEYADRTQEIDEEIRRHFEQKVAIFVLDMCGFTRTTMRYGIIHYLAMIAQMETLATPAIEDNGGRVIKQEADNLFAVFPNVAQAVEGAWDVLRSFRAADAILPDQRDIYGSIGIGYGSTLIIGDEDLFGNEMNLTCKLGEDLAESMEILLTEGACLSLPEEQYRLSPLHFSISGIELNCYRLER